MSLGTKNVVDLGRDVVYIEKLKSGGTAELNGKLRVGDWLVKVSVAWNHQKLF